MSKLESFIAKNLPRILEEETKSELGDRSTYIGASDIGGCPYKVVMSKKYPQKHELSKLIVFQRGHIAEDLVAKMFTGLKIRRQEEVVKNIGELDIKAHIDFVVDFGNRLVIVEVKTTSAELENPYDSWVDQVHVQTALLQKKYPEKKIEAHVLAIDLNSGWYKDFEINFSKLIYERALKKANHIKEAMVGNCSPRAEVQYYCSSCEFAISCPAHKAEAELPKEAIEDVLFLKKYKKIKKEADKRRDRLKEYLRATGITSAKAKDIEAVVSLKERTSERVDIQKLRADYPEIANRYLKTGSYEMLTII